MTGEIIFNILKRYKNCIRATVRQEVIGEQNNGVYTSTGISHSDKKIKKLDKLW